VTWAQSAMKDTVPFIAPNALRSSVPASAMAPRRW